MRWLSKKPWYGKKRTINKFLLFPLEINNEWRWLESTKIMQVYEWRWFNVRWAKEKSEKKCAPEDCGKWTDCEFRKIGEEEK